MVIAWLIWLLLVMSHDFLQRRVPNWLVAAGLFFGTAALISDHQPFGISWTSALTGCVAAFAAFLGLYAAKLMGAADVKFAAVLGLWIGLNSMFIVWLGSSLLAGFHALLVLGLQRWPISVRLLEFLSMRRAGKDGEKIIKNTPYAAYMAMTSIAWAILQNRNPIMTSG